MSKINKITCLKKEKEAFKKMISFLSKYAMAAPPLEVCRKMQYLINEEKKEY